MVTRTRVSLRGQQGLQVGEGQFGGNGIARLEDIREQQERSADTYSTALKIRELLEALETDWGEEAAERALAIVTGEET